MVKWILAAGAAALALTAPALAGPDKGNGGEKREKSERGNDDRGGKRAERGERGNDDRGGKRAERGGDKSERRMMRAERGDDGDRKAQRRTARADRNDDDRRERSGRRIARADRADHHDEHKAFRAERRDHDRDGRKALRGERRDERKAFRADRRDHDRHARKAFRSERRDDRDFDRREVRNLRFDDDRREIRRLRSDGDRRRFAGDDGWRGFSRRFDDCPPGLARKYNGCLPPGQAKRMIGVALPVALGSQLLDGPYRQWYRDSDRYYYRDDGDYIYRVNRQGGLVDALFPFQDRDYSYYDVGTAYPADYNFYNVPQQYQSYYADGNDYNYRYGDGAIYQVNRSDNMISSIVALLAGDLGVGQQMPSDYGVYNVPMAYRDRYYDTAEAQYRYNDGYIYQADPKTQLITAVIDALV